MARDNSKAAKQPAASAASKKRKKHAADPFATEGRTWKALEVGDELLVGAEHGGFMGLEVRIAQVLLHPSPTLVTQVLEPAPSQPATKESRKKSKKCQDRAQLKDLQQQLEALQAENARLKKRAKVEDTDDGDVDAVDDAEDDAEDSNQEQLPDNHPHADLDMSAWTGFDLHPGILTALQRCGFAQPTAIQQACLAPAMQGRCDVIGAAQTVRVMRDGQCNCAPPWSIINHHQQQGSGKTLAFGLPIIQRILEQRHAAGATHTPALRALVLAPTRELAMQVCDHMRAVAKPNGVWVVPIVGGISPQKQERLLRKRPEVVVATPGRLWDMMQQHHAHLTDMRALSFLVLDEADHMVQLGHFKELSSILALVPFRRAKDDHHASTRKGGKGKNKGTTEDDDDAGEPSSRRQLVQVFVFSATLTLPAALRQRLKGKGGSSGSGGLETLMDTIPFRPKPKVVDLTAAHKLGDKVSESYMQCSLEERDALLYALLALHSGRTLVFTNAISTVRRVTSLLRLLGLPASPLHASMQQRQRLKYLDRFRSNEHGVLVASDVAARGLDIPDVRCVVHYQIPASPDVYVHRCGRTARAARDGIAIALVTPGDSARFAALFKAFDRALPPAFPIDQRVLPEAHRRVALAVRIDERMRLLSKQHAASSWRKQTAAALDLEPSEEDEGPVERKGRAVRRHLLDKVDLRGPDDEAEAARLQRALQGMLSKPLAPGFSSRFFTGGAASSLVRDGGVEEASRAAAASSAAALVQAQQQPLQHKPTKRKASRLGHLSLAQQRALALQEALAKKKGESGRPRRVLVVPEALGRASQGEDALAALKRHAANTGMASS